MTDKHKIEELEEVQFNIDEEAYAPEAVNCSLCSIKMREKIVDVQLDEGMYIRVHGFECPQCKKQYLSLTESKKLNKALLFKRALTGSFKIQRNLSFDGDNYILRIPKEFTNKIRKRKVEIIPLGLNDFRAIVE